MSTPSTSTPNRVVILGGGLAGLAAAIRLRELGVKEVTILEKADRPGGLAISIHYDGLASDLGPHRIYTEIPEVERFFNEIAGEAMIPVKRRSRMRLNGRFLAYPLSIADMLRGPGPWHLARFGFSWIWTKMLEAVGAVDKSTFDGLMRSAFGGALFKYLIGPYTHKVWKTDPKDLDADAARVRVSAGSLAKAVRRVFLKEERNRPTSLREFRYIKGGAESLVRHLTDRAVESGVVLRLNHDAVGVELDGDSIRSVCARTPEGASLIEADAVISTIPLPRLAGAVHCARPMPPDAVQAVESLRYLDIIFVFVIVKKEMISGDNWIYFPESRFIFNRASESKAFHPSMGDANRSMLCVETTCRPGQDMWTEDDAVIARRVIEELATTDLFRLEDVEKTFVHRLTHGYPIYDKGYGKKLETVLRELARTQNLVSTGRQGLFNFNNMDHSIYMGLRAAQRVAESTRPAQDWLNDYEVFRTFRIVD